MEIKPIRIPRSVIKDIPPPAEIPAPVVRGIAPPAVNVPEVIIDYPTIDVPTREEFEAGVAPPKEEQPVQTEPNRPGLTTPPPVAETAIETQPSVNVGGVDIPIPEPGPLVAAVLWQW